MDNELVFEYNEGNLHYRVIFYTATANTKDYVDIQTFRNNRCVAAWWHHIKDGQVVWRNDNAMELTEGAKNYIQRLVKLRAYL